MKDIRAEQLGSAEYRKRYGLRIAYAAGAMVKGIASHDLVVRMARAGMMSYFGSGGLSFQQIEDAAAGLRLTLGEGAPYGMNLLCNTLRPEIEDETVRIFLRQGVRNIEASAFTHMTSSIVRFRLANLKFFSGGPTTTTRIQAKVSRPEVARQFLLPPPLNLVKKLLAAGELTEQQANAAPHFPMADDICVEADSGGHTDKGVSMALMPAMLRLREEVAREFAPAARVGIGAAGGIGTPEAAAAAFVLGADFILTGSINQCTVEAGTSDLVKDLLQRVDVQDTEMAPAGDMFEIGARVQVLKKGVFFPARANKLYDVYRQYDSLEDIDDKTRESIEKFFGKTLPEVERETLEYLSRVAPDEIDRVHRNPKIRMARVFQWYFGMTNRAALRGDASDKLNLQVHCGPAMGACNAWLRGSPLENWRNRHVDDLGLRLMNGAARVLGERIRAIAGEVDSADEWRTRPNSFSQPFRDASGRNPIL